MGEKKPASKRKPTPKPTNPDALTPARFRSLAEPFLQRINAAGRAPDHVLLAEAATRQTEAVRRPVARRWAPCDPIVDRRDRALYGLLGRFSKG